jgi:hypothetical protein
MGGGQICAVDLDQTSSDLELTCVDQDQRGDIFLFFYFFSSSSSIS